MTFYLDGYLIGWLDLKIIKYSFTEAKIVAFILTLEIGCCKKRKLKFACPKTGSTFKIGLQKWFQILICQWIYPIFFFFFYNKQLYFMKSICWYHIWSYKNTNLLNVVLFFLHILCSKFSLNLSTYKKWRNYIVII